MQPDAPSPNGNGNLTDGFEFDSPFRVLHLLPLLLVQGGREEEEDGIGMDLSKVGEKILTTVRSATSISFIPSTSDRPEVTSHLSLALILVIVLILYDDLGFKFIQRAQTKLRHITHKYVFKVKTRWSYGERSQNYDQTSQMWTVYIHCQLCKF